MNDNPIRILLIEDNPGDVRLIKEYLAEAKEAPFEIEVAEKLSEGLNILADRKFDLILLDLSLPDSAGIETLYKIKAASIKIAIIILTGLNDQEAAVEALRKGAQDYLLKDQINSNLLPRAIRYAIERKQTEEALRESEEKYRKLFTTGNDAIFLIDVETLQFVDANPAACKMYGYSLGDFLTKSSADISAETDKTLQAIKDCQTEVLIQYHKKQDGTIFPVEITTSEYVLRGRKILVAVIRDITEKMRAEEEKKEFEILLQQSQKMEALGTLAGGIAHDFNNILSAIIGYTELSLMKLTEDGEVLSNLNEIFKAGQRAKELVQQILTFSRQTKQELKPVQIDLIAEEVLKFLRASLPSTIEIQQDFRSNLLVMGDPTQIHQILMNLCTNAAHAMWPNGGILEISLANVALDAGITNKHPDLKAGPYVKLSVRDQGHGMPSDVLDRIFDPFFTTKEKGDGTGMGLSVVHGIVKSHGGMVAVYSKPGKGSVFTVFLPAVERRVVPDTRRNKLIPTGTERILFIDDEEALSKVGKQSLESLGYVVKTKTSSEEALALFKDQPDNFDLVITDMTMPNMTGDKLAKEIIAIRPDIPIILCSGNSSKIPKEKFNEINIKGFLTKPIAIHDLAASIRNVLDHGIEDC